jgi:similar to stage IV sporulation protein
MRRINMSKFKFSKYRNGIMTIEIITKVPEKFINLLWKNDIAIKNIKRKNLTTVYVDINLKDYREICNLAKRSNSKLKVIDRKGLSFFVLKMDRRSTIVAGFGVFLILIYVLSTYLWNIKINTQQYVSPFEIRRELNDLGIVPGISKSKIDTIYIEEKLVQNNANIMWARVRIDGAQLVVTVAERQAPPDIQVDNEPCNLVASKDGVVQRIFTNGGTAIVEKGDIVKKGDVLVKGEQGKEGSTYQVKAEGSVIAETFYESKSLVPKNKIVKERTGESVEEIYINLIDKKIFIKKAENKFENYDKIVINKSLYTKVIYYEVKEKKEANDIDSLIEGIVDDVSNELIINMVKSVIVKNKLVNKRDIGENIEISVTLVCEEDIALAEKLIYSEVSEN